MKVRHVQGLTSQIKLYIELTAAGDALKDKAIDVPSKMEGCLKLDTDERVQLKKLLDKAIIQMEV